MIFNPYPYQRQAIDWVMDHPRCGLFLDMGLGKSVITLTAVRKLLDFCEIDRVLVVAPKKVAETTWTSEADKWDHLRSLRVVRLTASTPKKRIAALETEGDVYVLGRDNFVWLYGYYKGKLPFDMIVIDELTSFKSHDSQRFKAMRVASAGTRRVVGLTGTPAPNGLKDLWGQLYCIDLGQRLGKYVSKYIDTYFDVCRHNGIPMRCTIRKGAEDTIRGLIADICLSMQAKDYLELPQLIVRDVVVNLPDKVRQGYEDFAREKVLELFEEAEDGPVITAASAAALSGKLMQYANGAVYDAEKGIHEVHNEKLDCLAELIEAAAGEPVLVFYQFKHDVERILRRFKGQNVRVYKGEAELIAWNNGEIDILLAHPASTAYGLNMQHGGHYIAWFGTGWDLELYLQANARLYRQGQTKPVTVFRLIAADTVDVRAAEALEGKKSSQEALLDSLSEIVEKYR